jgi:hypothetical protein
MNRDSNPASKTLPPKKIMEVRKEKLSTIPYSLRKIRINKLLPNSTLNPEISSLSPSLKSNGARLTSATTEMNQRGNKNMATAKEDHCNLSDRA